MSFVIQRVVGRGTALTQVRASVLRIGRGTNADLRSENPAVAFEHATIEETPSGYTITDKGSITGTYVNGSTVETAQLQKGDVIEVGDVRAEVQLAEAGKPLFLRVIPSAPQAAAAYEEEEVKPAKGANVAPGAAAVAAPKIDYAKAYSIKRPYLTKLSVAALLLVVAIGVIGEVTRKDRQSVFMPGGVSSAHARARDANGVSIAEQCDACHTPWQSVTDQKCMNCHPQAPHSQQKIAEPSCFSCHAEHRGQQKLTAMPESRCSSCHQDLDEHLGSKPQVASMTFGDGRYKYADIKKITSFGTDHPELLAPKDVNTLRFNHRIHLAGVFNAQGKREVLECDDCHVLVENKGKADPAPIAFEQHCQRCHNLTFDPRFPTAQVPHGGDPGLVYGFVLATYAGDSNLVGKSPMEVRRILSRRQTVAPDQRAVLNAEQVIKTKCDKCHDIERRGERLAAVPPVIRTDWFTTAAFTHTSHRQDKCESCHGAATTSSTTSDVLMPSIKNCTDCHGGGKSTQAQAASACVACHLYHLGPKQEAPVMNASLTGGSTGQAMGGEMLQTILIMLVALLLLVVLIPLSVALFQRVRAGGGERPAAAPRAAVPPPPPLPKNVPPPPAPEPQRAAPAPKKTPPPAPMPEAPKAAPAAAPAPPPRPFAPPEPEPTRMIDLGAPKQAEPAPAGTEMLQWYGMLHCTQGPLEGQRFVIEDEEGFYIGRDPSLSKIVINDARVSKRHVRIVPRNGKVWAVDQNSTNGTFMGAAGGQRITEVQLKRGDTIVLADNAATFVYQI